MSLPTPLTAEQKEALQNQTSAPPNWDGVYWLSPENIQDCNCMGWALGLNDIVPIPDTAENCLYLINRESENQYGLTAPDDLDGCKYLLWGPDNQNIQHITVLLSYDELESRSNVYDFLNEIDYQQMENDGIPNPFWSSAIGFGFGVLSNPEMWFEGGDHVGVAAGVRLI